MTRSCTCGAALGPKNKSGNCRSCLARRINADPVIVAKRALAIRARFEIPGVREGQSERMRKVTAGLTPAQMERRREHGRRQARAYLSRPDIVAKALAPEARARAGKSRTATVLAWCPPEWRDTYRELTRKGRRAAVAKAMVLEMIAGGTVVLYAQQKAKLAWCPEHRRDEYRGLQKQFGSVEARRIIEDDIAHQNDGRRIVAANIDRMQRKHERERREAY